MVQLRTPTRQIKRLQVRKDLFYAWKERLPVWKGPSHLWKARLPVWKEQRNFWKERRNLWKERLPLWEHRRSCGGCRVTGNNFYNVTYKNFIEPQPSALGMREEDCMNAARRVSEREGASQITLMNTDMKKQARGHSRREWGGQKQKLCKQACPIFAFFLPIPACWEQSAPI